MCARNMSGCSLYFSFARENCVACMVSFRCNRWMAERVANSSLAASGCSTGPALDFFQGAHWAPKDPSLSSSDALRCGLRRQPNASTPRVLQTDLH